MNDKILKILENRNIKPTSNRVLVLKAMLNFDWAFTLADLENELISVDKSTISRTIHLFRHQQLIHSFDDGSGSVKYAVCNTECNCSLDELHAHFYCNYSLLSGEIFSKQLLVINTQLVARLIKFFD